MRWAAPSDAVAAIAEARERIERIAGTIEDPELRDSWQTNVVVNARTSALAREWSARSGSAGRQEQAPPGEPHDAVEGVDVGIAHGGQSPQVPQGGAVRPRRGPRLADAPVCDDVVETLEIAVEASP